MIQPAEFIATVGKLAAVVSRWAPDFSDKAKAMAYYEQVMHLDFETLKRGCDIAARTLKEFPAPVELLEICCSENTLSDQQKGEAVIKDVMRAVRFHAASWDVEKQPLPWRIDEVHRRVYNMVGEIGWEFIEQMGGWWNFCNNHAQEYSSFNLNAWAKRVTAIYRQERAFGDLNRLGIAGDQKQVSLPPPRAPEEPYRGKLCGLASEIREGLKK